MMSAFEEWTQLGNDCLVAQSGRTRLRIGSSLRGQDPPIRTSLPPTTARISEGSFEIRGLELRVTGAINKTENIEEAQNHFIQNSRTYTITLNSISKN